jgi:FKBP12-rapamycin complex-associated protein
LTSTAISADVIFVLLNLAEFLEHDDKGLPIDLKTFGECALAYHAFAKALHYKELEFFSESSPAIIESLININTKLQQHDAAFGTLTLARDQQDLFKHEEWYEKLGKWHEALAAYNRKIADHDESSAVLLGRMRCLHALGEWDQLSYAVQETWINASHEDRIEIAPLAAAAAWSLSQWDQMEDYIGVMKGDSMDRSFYRAILAVHRNQFPKALQQIGRARDQLDGELTSRVGENYPRAYK